nr:MAG TPA: hypothetical protein [Bacteriophage sp.]
MQYSFFSFFNHSLFVKIIILNAISPWTICIQL